VTHKRDQAGEGGGGGGEGRRRNVCSKLAMNKMDAGAAGWGGEEEEVFRPSSLRVKPSSIKWRTGLFKAKEVN
jgi:hypothetical protein